MYTMYVPAHTRTYTQHTHTHCQHHVRKHAIVQHIMSTSTVPLMMYTMYVPAHTHTHTCTHAHIKIYKRCHRSQKRTKRGIRSPAVYFISPCLCTCAEEGCSANTHTHTHICLCIYTNAGADVSLCCKLCSVLSCQLVQLIHTRAHTHTHTDTHTPREENTIERDDALICCELFSSLSLIPVDTHTHTQEIHD
jgi:hypothetical protein